VLDRCGAVTITAASAAEGMACIEADPPDVLVADIEMPHEDGYSLIRRVRALPADRGGTVPAIALTSYASARERGKALAAGFQLHVAKPIEAVELAAAIARVVQSSRDVR
jgi:CheY-like chemotaxis protein